MHSLEDFIFEIFPEIHKIKNDPAELINYFENFYSHGIYKPIVKIKDGIVIVNINTDLIESQESDYRKVVSLCERGKYQEAKQKLDVLIEKNPSVSEYHRIYGQILSDEGKQDEAIDSLIDALRWDPKNSYALLMMGNIFGKFKNDLDTSMKYYEQALKTSPEDNITLNNIGATLMQLNKFEEAKKFFEQAAKINEDYPNTHYALSIISEKENNLNEAFEKGYTALKKSVKKNEIYEYSLKQTYTIADKIVSTGKLNGLIEQYTLTLESGGGIEIETEADASIETAAKFEFAENHNRAKHRLIYKPGYPAIEHLQMHELVHLEFATEARKQNSNRLFISTQQQKGEFIRSLDSTIRRFKKLGYDEKSISNYCSGLFNGINRQIFNVPIDLFIEEYLYKNYSELRPFQFISLYGLTKEALHAVTDKKIVDLSPKEVLSKSKIYNIVSALQFKDLYGVDLINEFKATNSELKLAQKFYKTFLEKKDSRKPGDEYELVQQWADELKLSKNFELTDEDDYRKRTNIDKVLQSIEKDPFDTNNLSPEKAIETEKFFKSQKEIGINMAVVMYMVDALKYFENMDKDEVKKVAFEIALLGTQGFLPEKKGYKLNSISGKEFSGYHMLAYYYVSWKLAVPEMLEKLKLPYDNEYEMAETLLKKGEA